jgi:hypothetical protein
MQYSPPSRAMNFFAYNVLHHSRRDSTLAIPDHGIKNHNAQEQCQLVVFSNRESNAASKKNEQIKKEKDNGHCMQTKPRKTT